MIKIKIILFCICILATNCSNYHYAIVPQYVPLNTGKGEFTANINLRSLQLGYSLTDHFAIHTLMYADIIDDSVENGKGFFSADDAINTYYRNSYHVMLGGSYFMNNYPHWCRKIQIPDTVYIRILTEQS